MKLWKPSDHTSTAAREVLDVASLWISVENLIFVSLKLHNFFFFVLVHCCDRQMGLRPRHFFALEKGIKYWNDLCWKRLSPPCDAFGIFDMKAACSPTSHVLLDRGSLYTRASLFRDGNKLDLAKRDEKDTDWYTVPFSTLSVQLACVAEQMTR